MSSNFVYNANNFATFSYDLKLMDIVWYELKRENNEGVIESLQQEIDNLARLFGLLLSHLPPEVTTSFIEKGLGYSYVDRK